MHFDAYLGYKLGPYNQVCMQGSANNYLHICQCGIEREGLYTLQFSTSPTHSPPPPQSIVVFHLHILKTI